VTKANYVAPNCEMFCILLLFSLSQVCQIDRSGSFSNSLNELSYIITVVTKLGCAYRSGARNIENDDGKVKGMLQNLTTN
jgi:hypothetical protein